MKHSEIVETIDETLLTMLDAADEYLAEIVSQFEDVGNPEELIKKPYETWTPEDLTMLAQIYGMEEPNPLSNLIFKKEYNKVLELEKEVKR